MQMKIGPKGLDLIKSFESFVPYVYDDLKAPVKGKYREWDGGKVVGTLTIGYGHTNSAKHPLKIAKGLRVTMAQAVEILDVDLDECEGAVNNNVKAKLTQGQFDALVSFAFNCGVGNLKKLIVPLNKGDYGTTRAKFDSYTRSKGQVLRGLVRRRDAEQALWDDRSADTVLPKEIVFHPAEVDAPTAPSMVTSKIGMTAGGISAAGAAQVIEQVNTAAETAKRTKDNAADLGIADVGSTILHQPMFWVAVLIVVAGVAIWLWRRQDRQHEETA